jgi:hypothetical protein
MENPRFTLEVFRALFPGPFESQDELLKEYASFLAALDQLDRVPVPELSAREKVDIFRRSWTQRAEDRSSVWTWLAFFKRPAVTFALGIALGCVVMFACLKARPAQAQQAPVEPPFAVERTRNTQTYSGRIVQGLYPQIENPRMVVEKVHESAPPQRVLYGTLDGGEVYVAWNL